VACTVDVVASAGIARFDFVLPKVIANEGDLADFCPVAVLFTVAIASVAALLADDMLSRATSVTGAAFRGQVRQLERRESSCGVSLGFSTLPLVAGVTGNGASSGLRDVAASVVGFVLTRLSDLSGAIEDYRGILPFIHMSLSRRKVKGVACGNVDTQAVSRIDVIIEALRGWRSATSAVLIGNSQCHYHYHTTGTIFIVSGV
jgi:hypothetical protein